jgi:gamma-glutamyltranspeptidase
MHHQWLPDRARIEKRDVKADAVTKLKAMGHDFDYMEGRQGDAHSIWVAADGTAYGVNDKRTADSKASVPSRLTSTAGRR